MAFTTAEYLAMRAAQERAKAEGIARARQAGHEAALEVLRQATERHLPPDPAIGELARAVEVSGGTLRVETAPPRWIRLDLSPSANRLVRPARIGFTMRLVKTTEAKNWLAKAQRELAALGMRPLRGPIEVWYEVHVPTIASDGPNRIKQLEDALTGFAWHDDCQVVKWHGEKLITEEERGFIRFRIVSTTTTQLTLKRLLKSKKGNPP